MGWPSEERTSRASAVQLTFYGQVKSYDYMPLLLSVGPRPLSLIRALYLASAARAFVLGGYISLLSLVSAKVVANHRWATGVEAYSPGAWSDSS